MKVRRIAAAVAAVVTLLALSTGCAKYMEPYKDAPTSGTSNGGAADLVRMPDGFSNIATKCDHGNRVYSAYHGDKGYASVAVVAGDPSCLKN